jgi:hypothetical protein
MGPTAQVLARPSGPRNANEENMDERLRVFLWIVSGTGFFALLGALFGALVGVVTRKDGRAAGSFIGNAVADSLARVRDEPLSDLATGAIVGGSDGAFFLALLGGLAGAVAGYSGEVEPRVAVWVGCGAVLLAVAAAALGLLAHGIAWAGIWAVAGICGGAVGGAILGARLGSPDTILYGTTAGALLGLLVGVLTRMGKSSPGRGNDPWPAPPEDE